MHSITDALHANEYPGRGIIIGRSHDNLHNIIAYFIMGRSENSRNRVFEQTDDGIRTRAFDESKCSDPSLIIYSPVRRFQDSTIVSNGDQTDTIYSELCSGGSFLSALMSRTFEPDAPNFTPRISGIVNETEYAISILKSEDGSGFTCMRSFFCYEFEAGVCHLIHTYHGNGNPLPPFCGEPKRLICNCDSAQALAEQLWQSLNAENKIALFVRYISLSGGSETVIINKHCDQA